MRAPERGHVEAGVSPRHHPAGDDPGGSAGDPRIHRVAGRTALVTTRPFRAPHHTIADVGLIGGG